MSLRRSLLPALLVLAVCVPTLRADDDAPRTSGGETRLARAADVVVRLESATKRLRATVALLDEVEREALSGPLDDLDEALTRARGLARPIESLAELTANEQDALAASLADRARPGDTGGWRASAIERAFEGVELTADEREAASAALTEWFDRALAARREGNSKVSTDLKRARDEQLEELLGRKRARRIANNLAALPGRGGVR